MFINNDLFTANNVLTTPVNENRTWGREESYPLLFIVGFVLDPKINILTRRLPASC